MTLIEFRRKKKLVQNEQLQGGFSGLATFFPGTYNSFSLMVLYLYIFNFSFYYIVQNFIAYKWYYCSHFLLCRQCSLFSTILLYGIRINCFYLIVSFSMYMYPNMMQQKLVLLTLHRIFLISYLTLVAISSLDQ